MGLCMLALAAVLFELAFSSPAGALWARTQCGPSNIVTKWGLQVDPSHVLQEDPRPQMRRAPGSALVLNGLWQYQPGTPYDSPPFGKQLNSSILVPFPVESCLSGVGKTAKYMWYRTLFAAFPTNRTLLHFGAVDWQTTVWINGQRMQSVHEGGFDSFSYDVTDAVFSTPKQNELLVYVYDPSDEGFQPNGKQRISAIGKPGGDTYTPSSGIWGIVWLENVAVANHVERLDIRTSMTAIQLIVHARLVDEPFTFTMLDNEHVVASTIGRSGKSLSLAVPNAKLWSPSSPFLYNATICLASGDCVETYLGMREFTAVSHGAYRTPLLNGKPVFLAGWLDQSFWPDGLYTAPTDAALLFDVAAIKTFGLNAVRLHQKVNPERWYYHADRLGVLVLQDAVQKYGGASAATVEPFIHDLTRMIQGRMSHPSIIQWTAFNEDDCWKSFDVNATVNLLRVLDPSRLVDSDSGGGATPLRLGDVYDIHDYAKPGQPTPGSSQYGMLGEFGGLGAFISGHQWAEGKCYAYKTVDSPAALASTYVDMASKIEGNIPQTSCSIYTQITDVELECDGFLNYDRTNKLTDQQVNAVAAANRAMIAAGSSALSRVEHY